MKIVKKVKCLKCGTELEESQTLKICTCGKIKLMKNTVIEGIEGKHYRDISQQLLEG